MFAKQAANRNVRLFIKLGAAMTVDYLGTYFTEDGFDFPGLINANFVQPVRILFQSGHFVSAAKLLRVAIDSISYVEFGDRAGTFPMWLKRYAQLGPIGVTAEELWEHRNWLLHMSNLRSRKVRAGDVRPLVAYVGELPKSVSLDHAETGYYDLRALILEFGRACGRWLQTYGEDRGKIDAFVERYDLIASDARMLHIPVADR
jgi:hypothetical protein